jgi:hypothetical protein
MPGVHIPACSFGACLHEAPVAGEPVVLTTAATNLVLRVS